MKKRTNLLFTLIGIFIFSACSFISSTNKPVVQAKPDPIIQDSLLLAQRYVEIAKRAEQIADTLGAESYFSRAMAIAEKRRKSSLPLDSTSQNIIENISREYALFLARLNGIEHDTLTAANVLEVLNALEDSISSNQAGSTMVTIPDVISNQEKLTIPLVLNRKVEKAIQYFQGKGRKVFTKWLQRSGRYRHLITRILREEGVPEELLYLAMIESGFNPYARSYARAVGIWQFIGSTGRAYGLRYSWWYDERRDPEKSTRAAARHLKDLYERFGNWYLALAGYNYSPRKIEKRLSKYNVDEYWELPRLPRQTRNYVPTFIAAALIAQNPEQYGFYVTPDPPVEYDTVTVRESVDLNVVAQCVGSTFNEIKKLNPALLRWCTPPDRESWVLNIPKGTREKFLENYSKIPQNQKFTWIRHRIRQGETLSTIARRYGVSMSEIKRFNKIRGSLIRAGHSLIIPVPQNKQYAAKMAQRSHSSTTYSRRKPIKNIPGKIKKVHVVQPGESLWTIAQSYGVRVSDLRYWNGLSYTRIIRPGQELNIWLPKEDRSVAKKETPRKSKRIFSETGGNKQTILYTVRDGDTLWDIALRYNVSIRELKKWNNRRSNIIKPGEQLKIIVSN